jgi:hypothetical protein
MRFLDDPDLEADAERAELEAAWHLHRFERERARAPRLEPSVVHDNRAPERSARHYRDQLRAMFERAYQSVQVLADRRGIW